MTSKRIKFISGLMAVALLQGCGASSKMYTKEMALGDTNKIVSVDAKQRLTFIRQDENGPSICAEPSPDALSSIVSGMTLGAEKAGTALSLALSDSEASASIGLRTQSIQLLRDGMYRICEAYYSGKLDENQVESLLKRYQDTMIAILAIESITGAVQSGQVVLTGKSRADIGKELGELSDLLTSALTKQMSEKNTLAAAKTTHSTAKTTQSLAVEASDKAKTELLTALADPTITATSKHEDLTKACSVEALDAPKKASCTAYIEKYTATEVANKVVSEAATAEKSASDKLVVADELVKAHKENIAALNTAGSTSADSQGEISQVTQRSYINNSTVQHIATAVVKIVDKSLLRNDVIETCLDLTDEIRKQNQAARQTTDQISKARAEKALNPKLTSPFLALSPVTVNSQKDKAVQQLKDSSDELACKTILKAYAKRFERL